MTKYKKTLALLGILTLVVPVSALAAIARDAKSNGNSSGTSSLTISHTTAGTNRILFCGIQAGGGDKVTGVTYAGVSMTQQNKVADAGGTEFYVYGLINPASGANNVVISQTGTSFLYGICGSYTGAQQSGLPDATNTNTNGSASTLTTSVTTVADKDWVFNFSSSGALHISASTNLTNWFIDANNNMMGDNRDFGDITPAGSFSQTAISSTSPDKISTIMVAFAPAGAAAATPQKVPDFFFLF